MSIRYKSYGKIDFGAYLHELRTASNFSQKKVADKLIIDISLLSKIEHGERQLQGRMLQPLAELFKLNYKEHQIQFLNKKIESEFGAEHYIEEAVSQFLNERIK